MASKSASSGSGSADVAAAATTMIEDAGGKRRDSLRQDLLPVDGDQPRQTRGMFASRDCSGGLRWDSWFDVQDSFHSGDADPVLSAVCFAHRWSPAAINAAHAFLSVRDDCQSYARLFLIDAAAEGPSLQEEVARLGVGFTPAYVIYYQSISTPLEVRRRGGGPHCRVIVGHLAPEAVVRILRMASMRVREGNGPGGDVGAALVIE